MEKPLTGKHILLVDKDESFQTRLNNFLQSLGASITVTDDDFHITDIIDQLNPDLIICDLTPVHSEGKGLIELLRGSGNQTPILVISATEKMSEIAYVLRLGVQDVLLKSFCDLNRLRKVVLECLYPATFTSKVVEEGQLFEDWDALAHNPGAAVRLLKQLQPPVQQTLAGCRIHYRQLTMNDKPGLVLDIAALSDQELAFYCLDVTRAGNNGVMAALLLRALFNGLLRKQLSGQTTKLPELGSVLNQVNRLVHQANLHGQFPLLVGYYQQQLQNLILVSAGLNATLDASTQQIQLKSGVPLGTMPGTACFNQISQHCDAWQCQISGVGGELVLMLSGL